MTDDRLTDLLHDRVADAPVGAPPLAAMHRDASRRARGRLAVLAAAASVVVVAGVVAVTTTGDGTTPRRSDSPAVASPSATEAADGGSDVPPDGFRWVGEGQAVIAVPEGWGTNAVHCGTPKRDTVIVDQGAICMALVPYPEDTSSVDVRQRQPIDERDDYTDAEVEGEPALLSPVECYEGDEFSAATCTQSLVLPDRDVVFAAQTSRGREALAPILDRVAILDEAVAVPGFQTHALDRQGRSGEAYADALRGAGFTVEVVEEVRRGVPAGYVLGAEPAPGTVVAPGATITVTQVAPPAGPADEIVLGMSGDRDGRQLVDLSDDELRTDPTVRLDVGDTLWTYAQGKRQRSYAATLTGDAIEDDGWDEGPNRGRSWVAARPGTSTVELSIDVDGQRLVLSTVTVVVR